MNGPETAALLETDDHRKARDAAIEQAHADTLSAIAHQAAMEKLANESRNRRVASHRNRPSAIQEPAPHLGPWKKP